MPCRTDSRGREARWPSAGGRLSTGVRVRLPWILLLVVPLAVGGAARIDIGRFSAGDLSGWERKSFRGETEYSVREEGGVQALCARSRDAGSGLFREREVDLGATPWIHWSWKVDAGLHAGDERTRAGDDYPARVYVVFSGGPAFWRTRAINYVWSSGEPEGAVWPNAFTANARMVAVRSGRAGTGKWQSESRDVLADYRRIFGEEPGTADAVAIMTDTDNTGAGAAACYGDIWFSADT